MTLVHWLTADWECSALCTKWECSIDPRDHGVYSHAWRRTSKRNVHIFFFFAKTSSLLFDHIAGEWIFFFCADLSPMSQMQLSRKNVQRCVVIGSPTQRSAESHSIRSYFTLATKKYISLSDQRQWFNNHTNRAHGSESGPTKYPGTRICSIELYEFPVNL